MTATLTEAAIRDELGRLLPLFQDAERAYERASASGGPSEIARCRKELGDLEQKKQDLEAALRGAQRFALERKDTQLLEAKRAAIAAANAGLDALDRQAAMVETLYDQLVDAIRKLHETEERISTAVARYATRETENALTQVSFIIGRIEPLETTLDHYPLVDFAETAGRQVNRARGLVDRIVALPPGEEK